MEPADPIAVGRGADQPRSAALLFLKESIAASPLLSDSATSRVSNNVSCISLEFIGG